MRFIQGVSVCAGTAVSRAIIRDLKTGPEAARLMASTFLVIGISPILAPLLGTGLMTVIGWRGLFVVLAALGLIGLAITRFALPESLPAERRVPRGTPLLPAYLALLERGRFLAAAAVAGLASTVPFAYLTAAPFVFSGVFGLGSATYSVLLAANAICAIGMMQLSPVLMRRWGARQVLVRASTAGVALVAAAALVAALGPVHVVVFQLFSMLLFAVSGLLLAPAAVTALDASGSAAGSAAGMLGTLQLVITAASSALISLFPAFSLTPLLAVLGGALSLATLLSMVSGPAAATAPRGGAA